MATIIHVKETINGCILNASGDCTADSIRRLLIQSALAMSQSGNAEHDVSLIKLKLLRSFLASIGATDIRSARNLLLMALLQIEDEEDNLNFVSNRPLKAFIPHE